MATSSPYSPFFKENWAPPTSDQVEEIQKIIEDRRQTIAGIEKILATFVELERQRLQAQESLDEHLKLLAPIRRVPDDILREIFVAASHPEVDMRHRASSEQSKVPATLMRVCKRWHLVASTCPGVWNHIVIQPAQVVAGRGCSNHWRELKNRLKERISRSGNLPLYLCIIEQGEEDDESTDWMEPIVEASHRWKSVIGILDYRSPFYTHIFSRMSAQDVPQLVHLALDVRVDDVDRRAFKSHPRSVIEPGEKCRIFRSESLRLVKMPEFPMQLDLHTTLPFWTNLTTIEDLWCEPYEIYRVMKACPNLLDCRLIYAEYNNYVEEEDNDIPVIESRLEKAVFLNFPRIELQILASMVDFVALRSLHIRNRKCKHKGSCNHLAPLDIILDHASTIEDLWLEQMCISGEIMMEYFEHLDNLRSLRLDYQGKPCPHSKFLYEVGVFDKDHLQSITPSPRATLAALQRDEEHFAEEDEGMEGGHTEHRALLPKLTSFECNFADLSPGPWAPTFEEHNVESFIRARRAPLATTYGVAEIKNVGFKARIDASRVTCAHEEGYYEDVDFAVTLARQGVDVEGLHAIGCFDYVSREEWEGLEPVGNTQWMPGRLAYQMSGFEENGFDDVVRRYTDRMF